MMLVNGFHMISENFEGRWLPNPLLFVNLTQFEALKLARRLARPGEFPGELDLATLVCAG